MSKNNLEAMNARCAKALAILLRQNPEFVVLNADVAKSVGINEVAVGKSERFLQLGISEQDMVLVAAGMASAGFVPIVTTFAVFGSLRVAEQVRTFVAYPRLNVKLVVSHGGLTPGTDGVTHQAVEDVAVMRAIPNMTIIEPFDAASAENLFLQAVTFPGPVYFRMNRQELPIILRKDALKIGKGARIKAGKDVLIIAAGNMVSRALDAAEKLKRKKIDAGVLIIHTIKPIDEKTIIAEARKTGAVVTAEEHSIFGGLGDAVSSVFEGKKPVPMVKVGVRDVFAESGAYSELVKRYDLSSDAIASAALKAVKLKAG